MLNIVAKYGEDVDLYIHSYIRLHGMAFVKHRDNFTLPLLRGIFGK
jgi:hypothetical protein